MKKLIKNYLHGRVKEDIEEEEALLGKSLELYRDFVKGRRFRGGFRIIG